MKKILFIGAGNMGKAIIKGLLKTKIFERENIYFFEPDKQIRINISNELNVKYISEIDENVSSFDYIVLAVKPQIFKSFSEKNSIMFELPDLVNSNQTIISIMAGIKIEKIANYFKNTKKIVRIMPNTPALVGESMSAIAFSDFIGDNEKNDIINIFRSIGKVEIVNEGLIDAITGLSGSGPAYVMMFIEALTQAGVLCGLTKNMSENLAIQTIYGSLKLLEESKISVEELKHMVTSPGGTTIHGIEKLEEYGFKNSIMKAVKAAYIRSKELSE